ncbi:MAG TPA: hypothetical protein VKB02_15045 [Pyrinomonadaceae bacterium]|nr:hypothetical protein [Pyrinomonadaceae bacterium]
MNDDYLWDKTGQPDPEIQKLEEILGALRYQPKPLVIPRRRNYFALMAIAASVLLAVAAGTIWLRVRSRDEAPKQQAKVVVVEEAARPAPPVNKSAGNQSPVVANNRRRKGSASSAVDRQEALKAKEQLMLALRVTSQKLHLVHTKTE